MDNLDNRLLHCFSSVFPELNEDQIRDASIDSVHGWHSLASVRLFAVLQEEFGLKVSLADLADLTSFSAVQNYVRQRQTS